MAEEGRTAMASAQQQTSPSRAVAAQAALPEWEGVPDTILIRVSAFLRCRADRVHMACVNRHWHAAVTGLRLGHPPPLVRRVRPPVPPQLPWLIFPSIEEPTFYSPLGRRHHRLRGLPPDVRRARFCGSGAGGWLLLALNSRHEHALYNLNSDLRILLPQELEYPTGTVLPLVVRAATLSDSTFRIAAIVLVGDGSTAAFWNVGRERWFSKGDLLGVTLQDVIFYGGGFFFITSHEDVIMFQPTESPDGNVDVARVDYFMEQREDDAACFVGGMGTTRRYLAESRGRLLMVVRYIYQETGTQMFRVFAFRIMDTVGNVEMPRATWDDLGRQLDGRMLFLGPGCSRSFEVAHYDGFQDQESMVFFLDESFDSAPLAGSRRLYSFTDMGRYAMEDGTIEPWPPEPRPTRSNNAPPTWWFY
jgi:hypothetical protein